MNNNANANKVSENKVFSEEFSISSVASTALTHIDKDGVVTDKFQYRAMDKDGNITVKSTNNLTTMQVVNAVQFFANVGKLSNKAIATEWGRVTTDLAKSEGFKTPAEMIKSIFPEYSNNTINQYRKVGQFFCVREEIETQGKKSINYRYRAGIDETVNITNLTQVISLANLPDNFEKLTKEEVDKLYSEFYKKYLENFKINLNLPQSELKKQIKTILSDNEAIDTTFTDKTDNKSEQSDKNDEKAEKSDKKSEKTVKSEKGDRNHEMSTKEQATEAIVYLSCIFKGDTQILKMLAKISESIEKLPDDDTEIDVKSDNSNNEQ